MSLKMPLKKTLNWLNTRANHSWTLGELVMLGASSKDQKEYQGLYGDHLTRAGRFTERAVTVGTAVALGLAGAMTGGFAVVSCLIAAKAAGYGTGRVIGAAVEKADHHFTPPAVDARDYRGYTRLARAVNKKDAAKVKQLLDAGADTEASVPSGYGSETVAELAAYSTPEIKKLFEDAAAKKAAPAESPKAVDAPKPAEPPKP
jgi:2,4-dienoyl-CoA reductase-like NADH-dependent reductase (Old Yellow Enzyme family)